MHIRNHCSLDSTKIVLFDICLTYACAIFNLVQKVVGFKNMSKDSGIAAVSRETPMTMDLITELCDILGT